MKSKDKLIWAAAGAGALWALAAITKRVTAYSYKNKAVLITGGVRGLGLVLARQLADEGARLVICSRNTEQVRAAEAELRQRGANVLGIVCDVTDPIQVEELIYMTRERLGQIDVLINNAGVIQAAPVEEMTLQDFEETMKIHFWAPLYTILQVMPHMKERGEGRIINISSIGGKISVPHMLPYNASKFALTGLSEGMRAELAKDGIVVTTVCPGLIRTGSPRNITVKGQHRKEYAWFKLSDSLPFLSMSAEKTAREILDACRYGEAELVTTIPAKAAVLAHGLCPGTVADALSLVNRMLPGPGGIGKQQAKGFESKSEVSESWLTEKTDEAAQKNNEL
ncbi:MAG: SDR family oxidoreductase [Hymenobacteraceae bacterium]|nr:SDR family oxidoreductase [Hymenobacteraceae bacterium]MDX5396909.1 SDR family oxidoreductase [Hymenobacteraceae bacterium]MDX5444270.1 SDR family oxidoreductase [Hymenobacteraceae bacterium]MDX5512983.1 SDR family oxidoreductase [Hymenobacteraceae bacterium]